MRLNSRLLPALLGVVMTSAACSDATRPDPRLQSPLVGQWMLETHSDTFVFVTGGPSEPDCPGYGGYCSHYRTTVDGAYLGGVLQVNDSLGPKGVVATSVQAAGTLTQRFCDSVDYNWDTGCTHVGPMVTASYAGEIRGTPDSTTTKSLEVSIKEVIPGTTAGRVMYGSGATYAGDSIYGGRFFWGEPGHSPHYLGTFVMRRLQ